MSISRQPGLRNDLETRGEFRGLEPSIEGLKLQVSAAKVPRRLETTKDILLSIIHTLRPGRNGIEETIFSFVERTVNLSMNIFVLFEMADSIPHIGLDDFHQVLEDVKVFVVSSNRWKSYPCSLVALRKAMDTKCRTLDQRLVSILEGLEATPPSLQTRASVTAPSNRCSNNPSSSLFRDANDFTVKNSQFYSAPGGSISFIVEGTNHLEGFAQTDGRFGLPGLIRSDGLELEKELYKGREYRLHRGRARGKAVVVKVFQGPRAKQLYLKTAEFNRDVMHSNVLRMIAGQNRDSGSPFIVFDGDYQGTVESQLAMSLRNGIKEGIVMGANTVIACSVPKKLGLDYLQELGLPFPIMGPEHFVLMVSKEGRIVINFDADSTWDVAKNDGLYRLEIGQAEKATEICNRLIQKTFYTSCKEYYRSQRSYIDEADDADETLFEDDSDFDEPEDEAEPSLTGSEALESGAPSRNHLRKSKGHRRELVWKSRAATLASLEDIGRSYQVSLSRFRSEIMLNHRRGHPMTQTAHRCPGYRRTEIILTPDIEQSGIVSHTSPIPNEICSVCRENVGNAEVFDCSCGLPNDDTDNSLPTVKCTICFRWQHQTCMKIPAEAQMKNFICWRCPGHIIAVGSPKLTLPTSFEIPTSNVPLPHQMSQPRQFRTSLAQTPDPHYTSVEIPTLSLPLSESALSFVKFASLKLRPVDPSSWPTGPTALTSVNANATDNVNVGNVMMTDFSQPSLLFDDHIMQSIQSLTDPSGWQDIAMPSFSWMTQFQENLGLYDQNMDYITQKFESAWLRISNENDVRTGMGRWL